MMFRLPMFLGARLSLGNGNKKNAPAVNVAVAAVALSVAVMLASVAIVNGFKREIKNKVVGFNYHLTLYQVPGTNSEEESQNLVSFTPTLKKILDETPYITNYRLELSAPSLLKTDQDFKGIYFKGDSDLESDAFLKGNLVSGRLPKPNAQTPEMLISEKAANELNLKTGDTADTYFIADDVKVRRMKIAGIYNSHFDSYDDLYVFGDLNMVRELTGVKAHEAGTIRIMTDNLDRAEEYAADLSKRLIAAYTNGEIYRAYNVESVYRQGTNYFQWLSLLDTNVFVILVLMSIVACVTIISGMLIIILDKVRFIGLIKSFGAADKLVRRVFVYLAIKVAARGLLIGNVFMLILLWIQDKYRVIPLDPDSYYIDYVPVELGITPIIVLNAVVLTLIFLILLLPSRFASTIHPAEAVRYEE